MITISQAMDRLKLREIKAGHVREDASYRAQRRHVARIVRRRLDGRRPRLVDLPYVAPPSMPPRTTRQTTATRAADRFVDKYMYRNRRKDRRAEQAKLKMAQR
jgi:hypothetical protein